MTAAQAVARRWPRSSISSAPGKLQTAKADWAANHVFIAGGITIVLISIVSLLAHRRQRSAHRSNASAGEHRSSH